MDCMVRFQRGDDHKDVRFYFKELPRIGEQITVMDERSDLSGTIDGVEHQFENGQHQVLIDFEWN